MSVCYCSLPCILSENLVMWAFFMRKNLKGFYIVLLVFILSVIGRYGSYLQSEDVFSTQIQRQNRKLSQKEKNTKVYASGVTIGICSGTTAGRMSEWKICLSGRLQNKRRRLYSYFKWTENHDKTAIYTFITKKWEKRNCFNR